VPLWVYAPTIQGSLALTDLPVRRLSDIAPTALMLLGFEAPKEMDPPLIRFVD